MCDVFISNAEEDAQIATGLSHGLEAAGYTTWYYERDSLPGPSYLEQIAKEIAACRAFLLVISHASMGSFQVNREVESAYEHDRPFVPLLRGITWSEFQAEKPSWRLILGTAVGMNITTSNLRDVVPRVIAGLRERQIMPSDQPSSADPLIIKSKPPNRLDPPWYSRRAFLASALALGAVGVAVGAKTVVTFVDRSTSVTSVDRSTPPINGIKLKSSGTTNANQAPKTAADAVAEFSRGGTVYGYVSFDNPEGINGFIDVIVLDANKDVVKTLDPRPPLEYVWADFTVFSLGMFVPGTYQMIVSYSGQSALPPNTFKVRSN